MEAINVVSVRGWNLASAARGLVKIILECWLHWLPGLVCVIGCDIFAYTYLGFYPAGAISLVGSMLVMFTYKTAMYTFEHSAPNVRLAWNAVACAVWMMVIIRYTWHWYMQM